MKSPVCVLSLALALVLPAAGAAGQCLDPGRTDDQRLAAVEATLRTQQAAINMARTIVTLLTLQIEAAAMDLRALSRARDQLADPGSGDSVVGR